MGLAGYCALEGYEMGNCFPNLIALIWSNHNCASYIVCFRMDKKRVQFCKKLCGQCLEKFCNVQMRNVQSEGFVCFPNKKVGKTALPAWCKMASLMIWGKKKRSSKSMNLRMNRKTHYKSNIELRKTCEFIYIYIF